MARRNLFQPPPPPPEGPAPSLTGGNSDENGSNMAKSRFPETGAMSGMKATLRDLSSNAVREIDPDLIEEDGPRDRLGISDADVADLAESLRQHGQQVPIMVRPLPGHPGRYRIVYGRRRLRALRLAGMPARALVRTLSDEQAVLAQGQENSQRLDPSFVEKALFATELADAGYSAEVITEALATDRPMLSRMTKVARAVPAGVIHHIGPAHGIGRRRWEELADLALLPELDLAMLVSDLPPGDQASDARFMQVLAAAQAARRKATAPATEEAPAPPALRPICLPDGTVIAELRDAPRSLTLRFGADPGFADWLRAEAEAEILRLYSRWSETKSGQ